MKALFINNKLSRLKILCQYRIVDTEPEISFDDVEALRTLSEEVASQELQSSLANLTSTTECKQVSALRPIIAVAANA